MTAVLLYKPPRPLGFTDEALDYLHGLIDWDNPADTYRNDEALDDLEGFLGPQCFIAQDYSGEVFAFKQMPHYDADSGLWYQDKNLKIDPECCLLDVPVDNNPQAPFACISVRGLEVYYRSIGINENFSTTRSMLYV